MEETMKLDTLEEILQEVKEVAEYDGRDLRLGCTGSFSLMP